MSRLGFENENKDLGWQAWMAPPSSLFYVHDTKKEPINVEIGAVHYFPDRPTHTPLARRDLHWLLRWHLEDVNGHPYYRVIEIRVEKQDDTSKKEMGLFPQVFTNWGPVTRSIPYGDTTLWINIGAPSLRQRRDLERIAAAEHVRYPRRNDPWNCQDWLKTVLGKAVMAGIFSGTAVHSAYAMLEGYETLDASIAHQRRAIRY